MLRMIDKSDDLSEDLYGEFGQYRNNLLGMIFAMYIRRQGRLKAREAMNEKGATVIGKMQLPGFPGKGERCKKSGIGKWSLSPR